MDVRVTRHRIWLGEKGKKDRKPFESLMQVYRAKWKPGGAYAGNASGTADPPPPEQLLVEQLLQFEYEVPPPPTHPHTHSRTHSPCV